MENIIKKHTDGGKTDWDEDLDLYLLAYRTQQQSSTKYSPYELVYGQTARLPVELDTPSGGENNDDDLHSMDDAHGQFNDRVVFSRKKCIPTDEEQAQVMDERGEHLRSLASNESLEQVRADALKNAKGAQDVQKVQYKRKRQAQGGVEKRFAAGDHVWVWNVKNDTRQGGKKIETRKTGPFLVVRAKPENNCYYVQCTKSVQQKNVDTLELAGSEIPLVKIDPRFFGIEQKRPMTHWKHEFPSDSPSPTSKSTAKSPSAATLEPAESMTKYRACLERKRNAKFETAVLDNEFRALDSAINSNKLDSPPPAKKPKEDDIIDLSSPTCPPREVWIEDLALNQGHKRLLVNPKEELNSLFIEVSQELLQAQHPLIQGLKAPGHDQTSAGFDRFTGEALQIILSRKRHHWLLVSTMGRSVRVLDSFFPDLAEDCKIQIAELCAGLADNQENIKVTIEKSQHQMNGIDCGLYAIANATELAFNSNVDFATVSYDRKQLRSHLAQCFEQGRLTPFPRSKRLLKMKNGSIQYINISTHARH